MLNHIQKWLKITFKNMLKSPSRTGGWLGTALISTVWWSHAVLPLDPGCSPPPCRTGAKVAIPDEATLQEM